MKKAEKALKDTIRKLTSTVGELKESVAKHAAKCLESDVNASDCVRTDDQTDFELDDLD